MNENIKDIKDNYIRVSFQLPFLCIEVCSVSWKGHYPLSQWVVARKLNCHRAEHFSNNEWLTNESIEAVELPEPALKKKSRATNPLETSDSDLFISSLDIENAVNSVISDQKYFRQCLKCKQINVLGHMHNDNFCSSCAENYLGIVY